MPTTDRRRFLCLLSAAGASSAAGCSSVIGSSDDNPTATGGESTSSSPGTTEQSGRDDIPESAYPPGVDESGIQDIESLFQSHIPILNSNTYTFDHVSRPNSGPRSFQVHAAQNGDETGQRYRRKRATSPIGSGSSTFTNYVGITENWHGKEMPVEKSYQRTSERVITDDPEGFNRSELSDEYSLNDEVTYRTRELNSLLLSQRGFIRRLHLGFSEYEPSSVSEIDGRTHLTLTFQDTGEVAPSVQLHGQLVVRSDGLIRSASAVLIDDDNEISDAHSVIELRKPAGNRLQEPDWVEPNFGT